MDFLWVSEGWQTRVSITNDHKVVWAKGQKNKETDPHGSWKYDYDEKTDKRHFVISFNVLGML